MTDGCLKLHVYWFRYKLLLRSFADCIRQIKMVLGVLAKSVHKVCTNAVHGNAIGDLAVLVNFAIDPREENKVFGFGLCFKLEVSLCCGNCVLSNSSSGRSGGGSNSSTGIASQSPARKLKPERIKSAPGKPLTGASESSASLGDAGCFYCDFPRNPIVFSAGGHFEQRIHCHRPPAASRLAHTPPVIAFGFQLDVDNVLQYLVKLAAIPSAIKLMKKSLKQEAEKSRETAMSNAGVASLRKILSTASVADVLVSMGHTYHCMLSVGSINDRVERYASEMGAMMSELRSFGITTVSSTHQLQVGNGTYRHMGAISSGAVNLSAAGDARHNRFGRSMQEEAEEYLHDLFSEGINASVSFLVVLHVPIAERNAKGDLNLIEIATVSCSYIKYYFYIIDYRDSYFTRFTIWHKLEAHQIMLMSKFVSYHCLSSVSSYFTIFK